MTRRRLYAAICLVTSVFTIDLTACAPQGPSTHDLSDPTRHDPLAEDYWKLDRVGRGTVLTMTTRDSGVVVGHYDGFDRQPPAEYEARYRAWLADSSAPAPRFALGEPVRVEPRSGAPDSGAFLGFDFGVARYARAGESRVRLAVFRELRQLHDSSGAAVTGDTLTSWLEAGRLPLGSSLRLTDHGQTRHIPLDRIASLRAHGIPVWVKFAVVAGFVTILIVAYAARPKPKPATPAYGCDNAGSYYVIGPSGAR